MWTGKSATVARALRLINDGALDDGRSLDEFAGRLGVSARHLRRLFQEELGASPSSVANTRRLHFARRLLGETELPVTQVAFASGFGSVRRFNEAMRQTFRCSPRELRLDTRARDTAPESGEMILRVPVRLPFDWEALLGFLRTRAIPGVEAADANSYARTFALGGAVGTLRVSYDAGDSFLSLSVGTHEVRALARIVDRVRRVFDCDADTEAISAVLSADERLRSLVALHPGLRVPGAFDAFELAVRAVLGQQISVAGARTMAGRLAGKFGLALNARRAQGLTHLFPSPEVLANSDVSAIGLTQARANTIAGVARLWLERAELFHSGVNVREVAAALLGVTGIGEWTAEYISMRAFNEPDAFPSGDLGLRKAVAMNGCAVSQRELEKMSEAWRPWRAYATMHLWTGLSEATR